MTPLLSGQNPEVELKAAFGRHLPQRLTTLLRRARGQCRNGWDYNVLHALHDEFGELAGTCGRYGMLETGERLLALEAALAPYLSTHQVPDPASSTRIGTLLDSLRPHLQQLDPGPGLPAWGRQVTQASARAPFPRCEVPPPGYAAQLGVSANAGDAAVAPTVAAAEPLPADAGVATRAETPSGPRVCILNDDDPAVSELMVRLDQRGCNVSLVERLEELIGQVRGAPPQLAVVVVEPATTLEPLALAMREARRNPRQSLRLLVLLRDADVDLRLRALRIGADRCIALPGAPDDVVTAALELAMVQPESPYRVLIVDDDAPQALFAQAILRRAGMDVRILGESLAALEELDRFQPDLLLLDLNMPDCDGFELTALIREHEDHVNTPIVFLSGDQDEDRQFAALDAGADDFLVKPIRPAHLVSAVTSRVRRARTAAARNQRQHQHHSDDTAELHERAELLDSLSEHLAAPADRGAVGGLLAVEVRDAVTLRSQFDSRTYDRLLDQVGDVIVREAGSNATTTRHGEAGFLVFTPTRGEHDLRVLAENLAATLGELRFGSQASAVRFAFAACGLGRSIREPAVALAAVDDTLRAARTRPAAIAIHSSLTSAPDGITQHIALALANGSFHLAFQPIIPIQGAARPHYQALLRLRHGQHEFAAAELVPAAIRAGSIGAVDAWVIDHCIGILTQRRRGMDATRLFASQSLHGWGDRGRAGRLAARLATTGVDPATLVLEFRCEEIDQTPSQLVALGLELKSVGLRLALAGVDASAIAATLLRQLPLDYVKLAPDVAGSDLTQVVTAAHTRHLRVIAPRIETVARAEYLRAAGVDLLQGNYFQAPSDSFRSMPDATRR